jgi:alpha-1,2-mannosyltransferase
VQDMVLVKTLKRWKVLDVLLVGSALVILILGFALYARFNFSPLAGITNDSIAVHMDFDVFLHSARALWEGGVVYTENGGPSISTNPPLWTVLVAPLALLEPITAYRIFVLVTGAVGVVYVAWMAEELGLRPAWTVVGMALLLFSNPFLGGLALGQVYPLLTLGLVAAWVADRRGKPTASGVALGLVLAVKPQFAPVLLWPLGRRRWRTFVAAIASGAAAMIVGIVVAGPRALIDWVAYVSSRQPDGYWDNNTLPAAAARLFRDNDFVEPLARLPWAEPVAYVLAVGIIILTALWVRHDPEMGLWALVAASLLAPSVSWHNYLVLLGPGILLLLSRGWTSLALLLLAFEFIPPVWSEAWRHGNTVAAALMLNLYLYILLAHWLVFMLATRKKTAPDAPSTPPLTRLQDPHGLD